MRQALLEARDGISPSLSVDRPSFTHAPTAVDQTDRTGPTTERAFRRTAPLTRDPFGVSALGSNATVKCKCGFVGD